MLKVTLAVLALLLPKLIQHVVCLYCAVLPLHNHHLISLMVGAFSQPSGLLLSLKDQVEPRLVPVPNAQSWQKL